MDTIQFNKVLVTYHIPMKGIRIINLMREGGITLIEGVVRAKYEAGKERVIVTIDAASNIIKVQDDIINFIMSKEI